MEPPDATLNRGGDPANPITPSRRVWDRRSSGIGPDNPGPTPLSVRSASAAPERLVADDVFQSHALIRFRRRQRRVDLLGYGSAPKILAARQDLLLATYAAHPERFVRKPPSPLPLPRVWINPPTKSSEDHARGLPKTPASSNMSWFDLIIRFRRPPDPSQVAFLVQDLRKIETCLGAFRDEQRHFQFLGGATTRSCRPCSAR